MGCCSSKQEVDKVSPTQNNSEYIHILRAVALGSTSSVIHFTPVKTGPLLPMLFFNIEDHHHA